jgi:hypothetical protein
VIPSDNNAKNSLSCFDDYKRTQKLYSYLNFLSSDIFLKDGLQIFSIFSITAKILFKTDFMFMNNEERDTCF